MVDNLKLINPQRTTSGLKKLLQSTYNTKTGCMSKDFLMSRLFSLYFQQSQYRGKIFFQKLNYWNNLAWEFCLQLTAKKKPCGSSRWHVHLDLTKKKGKKNLFDPILTYSIFVLLFPRNPMKSFAEDLHIPSKMKLHVEFLSNLSPVGERINLNLRKIRSLLRACILNVHCR